MAVTGNILAAQHVDVTLGSVAFFQAHSSLSLSGVLKGITHSKHFIEQK